MRRVCALERTRTRVRGSVHRGGGAIRRPSHSHCCRLPCLPPLPPQNIDPTKLVLKVDTEGAERDILRQLKPWIAKYKPSMLLSMVRPGLGPTTSAGTRSPSPIPPPPSSSRCSTYLRTPPTRPCTPSSRRSFSATRRVRAGSLTLHGLRRRLVAASLLLCSCTHTPRSRSRSARRSALPERQARRPQGLHGRRLVQVGSRAACLSTCLLAR